MPHQRQRAGCAIRHRTFLFHCCPLANRKSTIDTKTFRPGPSSWSAISSADPAIPGKMTRDLSASRRHLRHICAWRTTFSEHSSELFFQFGGGNADRSAELLREELDAEFFQHPPIMTQHRINSLLTLMIFELLFIPREPRSEF